jgi:Tfp pilus assembly protein PilF
MHARVLVFGFLMAAAAAAQNDAHRAQADRAARIAQLKAQVQQDLRARQPELAIVNLREIVKLDPSNAEAHANLGVLLYFQKDYKAAVPELRTALKARPEAVKIEALLGLAEDRTGETDAARREMEHAFSRIDEENVQSEVGLALAASYLRGGEPDKAAVTLSELLRRQPTNRAALYRAYRVYADLADRALLTLGMTAPGSAEIYVSMGRELARRHEDDAAIANFRQAAELDPAFPGVHRELGRLLFSSTMDSVRQQATKELAAAVAEDPDDEQALLLLGVSEQRAGNETAARTHLRRAVQLAPNDSDACTELAKLLVNEEDRAEAVQLLERAVTSDPANYVAHFRLATLYRQAGRKDDARREAEEYQKYKKLSERLQKQFDTMRLGNFERKDEDETTQKP